MVCEVRSLKSLIKTRSSLQEIITSSNEVLKDSESDIAVGILLLRDPTREAAKSYVLVKKTADSYILARGTSENIV